MPLKPCSRMLKEMRPKIFATLFVAAVALAACLFAAGAHAQRGGASRQANDNAASGARQKRVIVGRGSDTGKGSRVTITADDSLKDYSAYRSGDRFYVVLPKSAAARAGGGSGKGYSDMQVQQRGDSVVLSYRVQPGAKPRVEQKNNRLDVIFDVPEGSKEAAQQSGGASPQPTPATGGNQNASAPPANEVAARATPQGGAASANADEKNSADIPSRQTEPAQAATPTTQAASTPTASDPPPQPKASTDSMQLTQARQPSAPEVAQTPPNPATSFGSLLTRNWVAALLTAALLVTLGLFVVLRRRTPVVAAVAKEPAAEAKADVRREPEAEEPPPASSHAAGPQPLAEGAVLQNRYRVVCHLGRGGMGSVYEATDQRLCRTVALKMTLARSTHLRHAFEREARILANLKHSALPRVIDHFSEDNEQFLVMDYVPGPDLKALLQQQGRPFAEAEVLRWADELLDALEYLHSHEPAVVHRDIKPSNLKLTAKGGITLLDFGLAKGAVGQTTSATLDRSVPGYSPHYAPPEQMQGERTDPRSDLYSLGATLYHLLTGQVPSDALRRVTAQLHDEPDPLRPPGELNPAVSAHTSFVIMRALALKPAQRWPSAASMRAALATRGDASTVTDSDTEQASTLESSRTPS